MFGCHSVHKLQKLLKYVYFPVVFSIEGVKFDSKPASEKKWNYIFLQNLIF